MPHDELTRIILKPRLDGTPDKQVYITRTEMSEEELKRTMAERKALFCGMLGGGTPLLDGMEKLFGDIDPELKEAIDRARAMGRLR